MGDKNPKSKQRAKDQKSAVKNQNQNTKDKRQANFSSASEAKDKKK